MLARFLTSWISGNVSFPCLPGVMTLRFVRESINNITTWPFSLTRNAKEFVPYSEASREVGLLFSRYIYISSSSVKKEGVNSRSW